MTREWENLEIESKFQISSFDFHQIRKAFIVYSYRFGVINYYDNNNFFKNIDGTFRIYSSGKSNFRTLCDLKLPKFSSGGIRSQNEYSFIFSPMSEYIWPDKITLDMLPESFQIKLNNLHLNELYFVARTLHYRWHMKLGKLIFDLDKVIFPDNSIFYEIEFESNDHVEHILFQDALRDFCKVFIPSTSNKYSQVSTSYDNWKKRWNW